MATYYKYAEQQADSQVNWAEVGKNMSDMLLEEQRIREEKKAAIDKATRDFGETLANAPQGEHVGANQWALEYGDNASQYMLMQERLLKSGQMKLKDYTVARQNLLDGTNQAFNLAKEYQATYKEKMERYKNGDSQDLELWLNAQAEGFADFTKSQLYINPTNGTVNVAMKEEVEENGQKVYKMTTHPDKFATINTIRSQISSKYDKFNTNAATDAFVKGMGDELQAVRNLGNQLKSGDIRTTLDITKRTDIDPATKQIIYEFKDAETKAINGMLENPLNRSSVLTNSAKYAPNGKQYTYTYSETDAANNPELILLRKDPKSGAPMPDFINSPHGKEQAEQATEWVRTEARTKYDMKETITPYQEPKKEQQQQWQAMSGEAQKQAVNIAQNIGKLWGAATDADMQSAVTAFRDTNPNILSIDRNPDSVTVSFNDGTSRTLPFKGADGKLMTQEQFILSAGPLLAGNIDIKTAMDKGGLLKGATFNATAQQSAVVEGGKKKVSDAKAQLDSTISNLDAGIFNKKQDEVAKALNDVFAPFGITFSPTGTVGNFVSVSIPGKPTFEIGANAYTAGGANDFKNDLIDYINKNLPDNISVQGLMQQAGNQPVKVQNTQGVGSKY